MALNLSDSIIKAMGVAAPVGPLTAADIRRVVAFCRANPGSTMPVPVHPQNALVLRLMMEADQLRETADLLEREGARAIPMRDWPYLRPEEWKAVPCGQIYGFLDLRGMHTEPLSGERASAVQRRRDAVQKDLEARLASKGWTPAGTGWELNSAPASLGTHDAVPLARALWEQTKRNIQAYLERHTFDAVVGIDPHDVLRNAEAAVKEMQEAVLPSRTALIDSTIRNEGQLAMALHEVLQRFRGRTATDLVRAEIEHVLDRELRQRMPMGTPVVSEVQVQGGGGCAMFIATVRVVGSGAAPVRASVVAKPLAVDIPRPGDTVGTDLAYKPPVRLQQVLNDALRPWLQGQEQVHAFEMLNAVARAMHPYPQLARDWSIMRDRTGILRGDILRLRYRSAPVLEMEIRSTAIVHWQWQDAAHQELPPPVIPTPGTRPLEDRPRSLAERAGVAGRVLGRSTADPDPPR